MAVVVATRMKIGRLRDLPAFFVATFDAAWQARRTPGFLRGRLRVERGLVFWTLTVWESGRPVTGFRDSGAHARIAPKLTDWAREAVFGVWSSPSAELPSWTEASTHVAAHPNVPPLTRPSPSHGDPRAMNAAPAGVTFQLPGRRQNKRVTGDT